MSIFYYKNFPTHFMQRLRSVRDPVDNLWNVLVLVEAINSHPEKQIETGEDGFDVAVFTKDFHRFLVRKDDGYFSMSNPFQVHLGNNEISFNCDVLEEAVSGRFISIIRNAIQTVHGNIYSHNDIVLSLHENFGMEWTEAAKYSDTFASLLSDDHGYFRFDDDPDRQNGDVHPRYHFDIFFKNSSSLKVGYDKFAELQCFLALADKNYPKKYLLDSNLIK
ncbi:hypothetical protein HYN47_15540 [Vibrio parahaemolyticus]|uniref:hypothetical protein n=1 Tax=Vibrio parahaemolyticus TaxID=670 RepID=UPI0007A04A2C|nr:hypothetical protein [Vibrio parahaemolyticus]KYZ15302.1 hypothetical protein AW033_03745 [Vibrio parahaemolyticus]MBM5289797.1 hypothetical protein [Vibrio parahaemolyticus]MCF9120033.1 hypothetical protein [Vibrio parahaemolyticus]